MASSVAIHAQSLDYGQRLLASAAGMQIGECATVAVRLQETVPNTVLAMTPHPVNGFRESLDEMMGLVDTLVIPKGGGESACSAEDLTIAVELAARGSEVKIKIDENEVRALFQRSRARAVVWANRQVRHPRLGGGVLIGLQGVREIRRPEIDLVLSLNESESRAQVPIHAIGSWLFKDGMLAHACFIPNALYDRNVFVNLFLSNFIRALWAYEVVDDL
jgi:hypothetical protein